MDASDVFVLILVLAVVGILAWAERSSRRQAKDREQAGADAESDKGDEEARKR